MYTRTVRTVMTRNVVTARPGTGFKDLVAKLADERVSALPIVDNTGHVVGIVSEGDLLHRLELPPDSPHHRLFHRDRPDPQPDPLTEMAAGLMTHPAVTIGPDATVGSAARLMDKHSVKRLPVVDGGHLVGIVSRRDLLSAYLRADDEILTEVRTDVLQRVLLTDPAAVAVAVTDGIVTLTGSVDRRSTADIAGRLARAVSGVVDVLNLLEWQYDDSAELKRHYVFDAQVGPTVRWPD
jgi:CBS domain-containing protein